jgi:LytS/YehU family sensor histidine kinase
VFLNKKNESKVNKEKALRENLEIELQTFKNQVNPELLFQSLEVIISELHRDKKSADSLIDNLSKIYRYTLDNKNDDLVTLEEEINSLKPIYNLFKAKYDNAFSLDIKIDDGIKELNLIPGTLQLLMEYALSENIINEYLPLNFKIVNNENQLLISYKLNKRISEVNTVKDRLDFLFKTYEYYSEKGHKMGSEDGVRYFEIPLIEVEEE